MGNTVACVSKGTEELQQARVLLPDGEIVMLDMPVVAADLMMEHLNHMVVHCSTSPGSMRARPTMTIMQAHENLQPGQSYVVHPISTHLTKSKFRPQPLSMQQRNYSTSVVREDGHDTQEPRQEPSDARKKTAKQYSMQRFQNRVTDSGSSRRELASNATESTPELNSGAPQSLSDDDAAAREPQQDPDQDEDDDGDIVLNLNMYMGWRPALESIPESPLGYNHAMDNMQTPPVLCV